jgi:predicted nucleic acid-binding Zn ribbon protein
MPPLGIFWPLCCLFFCDIHILIIPLVSFGHCVVCSSMIYRFWLHPWYILAIVLSVLLWYTDSDYPLGICWPLCCLFFYDLHIVITPLASFGHCVVCSSMIKIPRGNQNLYIIEDQTTQWPKDTKGVIRICISYKNRQHNGQRAIVLSVLLWYTDSDYTLGIFWPLCCLFLYDIQILITPLVSFGHCVVCSSNQKIPRV